MVRWCVPPGVIRCMESGVALCAGRCIVERCLEWGVEREAGVALSKQPGLRMVVEWGRGGRERGMGREIDN